MGREFSSHLPAWGGGLPSVLLKATPGTVDTACHIGAGAWCQALLLVPHSLRTDKHSQSPFIQKYIVDP